MGTSRTLAAVISLGIFNSGCLIQGSELNLIGEYREVTTFEQADDLVMGKNFACAKLGHRLKCWGDVRDILQFRLIHNNPSLPMPSLPVGNTSGLYASYTTIEGWSSGPSSADGRVLIRAFPRDALVSFAPEQDDPKRAYCWAVGSTVTCADYSRVVIDSFQGAPGIVTSVDNRDGSEGDESVLQFTFDLSGEIEAISTGTDFGCAASRDRVSGERSLHCWGRNDDEQLGFRSVSSIVLPTRVSLSNDLKQLFDSNVPILAAGHKFMCAALGKWIGCVGGGTNISSTTVAPRGMRLSGNTLFAVPYHWENAVLRRELKETFDVITGISIGSIASAQLGVTYKKGGAAAYGPRNGFESQYLSPSHWELGSGEPRFPNEIIEKVVFSGDQASFRACLEGRGTSAECGDRNTCVLLKADPKKERPNIRCAGSLTSPIRMGEYRTDEYEFVDISIGQERNRAR